MSTVYSLQVSDFSDFPSIPYIRGGKKRLDRLTTGKRRAWSPGQETQPPSPSHVLPLVTQETRRPWLSPPVAAPPHELSDVRLSEAGVRRAGPSSAGRWGFRPQAHPRRRPTRIPTT